jgi:hypothetical protein
MTRTDSYHICLLFVYALKTDKRKTPHTCLYQPHGGYRSPFILGLISQVAGTVKDLPDSDHWSVTSTDP